MQIQQQLTSSSKQFDSQNQLREGDVYRATIKERTGERDAIVSIRGRDVPVIFEGSLPSKERVHVQVTENRGDSIRVKVAEEQTRQTGQGRPLTSSQGEMQQRLQHLGVQQPSRELTRAAMILHEQGVSLNRNAVRDLQQFIQTGNANDRLQTIQAIANKRLDITPSHLRAVDEALHGRPLNQVLTDLAREIKQEIKPPSREHASQSGQGQRVHVEEIRQLLQSDPRQAIERLVRMQQHLSHSSEGSQATERLAKEARQLQQAAIDRILQALPQSKEFSSLRQQIQERGVTEEIRQRLAQMNLPNRDQLDRAIRQSVQLQQAANERVMQALSHNQSHTVAKQDITQQVVRIIESTTDTGRTAERLHVLLTNENRTSLTIQQIQQLVEGVRQHLSQGRAEQAIQQVTMTLSQTNSAEAMTLNTQTSSPGSLSNVIHQFVEQSLRSLQTEPNFQRAIEQIQTQLVNRPFSETIKNDIQQQIAAAQQTEQSGREMKARQEVAHSLQQLEQQTQPTPSSRESIYIQNEQFQTSQQSANKMIAVTTVTERMAQLTADFKQFQRELHRSLDQTARLIEQFRSQAQQQAKPMLEKTIKRLDNAILKSEMMLFTDMKTERELMQASNRLAEAKQLLARGSHREANQIVREVSQLVEKVHFQPSETKVKHYTAAREEAVRNMQLPEQNGPRQMSETIRPIPAEPSPRAMLELIRSLGLNRDSELAQQFASGNREHTHEQQQNLKSLLMQLARGEEEGTRANQLANQALNNLTGQQLLSRSDQQNMQSLFFQLPFLLEEKVENLKVFVNSRNEDEQVDWENCSIYFLMQTPKMGDIGILVSVKDRQLSVTLKNDQLDFQAKMEPFVQQSIDKLGELGFNIKGIHFAHLQEDNDQEKGKEMDEPRQRATFTEKGFDFKV
ncbi:hypothetical protein ACERJO_03155 [Halalkalibacter sp. AB-rgal2]|uniref:hypothetical protein n=1 Tax=Halalkalibacter sp. AB-rgal2 TaxID=3242695 RepID=UPI00359EF489